MSIRLPADELGSVGRANSVLWHGLLILHRAWLCARAVQADPWDFAVEIDQLLYAGLTKSDLRWYLATNLIEADDEVTAPGERTRSFRGTGFGGFAAGTCFVLSAAGTELVGQLNASDLPPVLAACAKWPITNARPPASANDSHLKPRWDPELKELCAGPVLVKRFRSPAINQEIVLTVFEEENWPRRIDDPLPVVHDQDAKRRLHDTIKCLNRNHQVTLLRFRGDGTGEGVLWELQRQAS